MSSELSVVSYRLLIKAILLLVVARLGQPIKHVKVVILLRCGLCLLLLEAPVEHLASGVVSHAKVAKAILLGDLLLHVQASEKRVV